MSQKYWLSAMGVALGAIIVSFLLVHLFVDGIDSNKTETYQTVTDIGGHDLENAFQLDEKYFNHKSLDYFETTRIPGNQ